jgi:hypothetical protein
LLCCPTWPTIHAQQCVVTASRRVKSNVRLGATNKRRAADNSDQAQKSSVCWSQCHGLHNNRSACGKRCSLQAFKNLMTECIRSVPSECTSFRSTNRVSSHLRFHSRLNQHHGLTRRSSHPPFSDIPKDLLYLPASMRRSSCTHPHHPSCGPGVLHAYFGLRQDLIIANCMCKHVLLPDQPLLQRFSTLSDDHDSLLARFPLPHDFTFVAARRSVSTSIATPH